MSFRQILNPRSLPRQILLLAALVITGAAIVMATISQKRLNARSYQALESQVSALTQSAASASAQFVVVRDLTSLEQTLLDISRFPGITEIVVTKADGHNVIRIYSAPSDATNARKQVDFQPVLLDLPPTQTKKILSTPGPDATKLEVWQPLDEMSSLGWVRLTYSLQSENRMQRQMLRESVLSAFIIAGITIAALHFFLRRALKPLQRSAQFAAQLANHIGATLEQDNRSLEVEELTQALNRASLRMQYQLHTLQQAETQKQAILNTAADPIVGLDINGCIKILNPAVTSIFGVDDEKTIGQHITSLIPGLTSEKLQELIETWIYFSNGDYRIARLEMTGMRNGGVNFPIEVSIGEMLHPGALRYTCIVRDLTEKREAEEAFRLFSRAVDCSINGIVISDMRYPHQPIVYTNPAFTKITGYSSEEVLGINCSLLQKQDKNQSAIDEIHHALKHGLSTTVTLRNYRKDGDLFWNELSLSPVKDAKQQITHFIGMQSDVTGRVTAEHVLEEHSDRLNTIFDLSPDGFVLFDQNNFLVYFNPEFIRMTGLEEAHLSELDLYTFDHLLKSLCDSNYEYVKIEKLLEKNSVDETSQVHLILPERKILSRQIRHSIGSRGQTVMYFRDITRESEVDRIKSEFLSTAAHELRTPMASLFGFTELLLKRKYDEARQRDMLETMHRQAALLINLINELLDLARIEARQGKDFKIGAYRLADLVQETVASFLMRDSLHQIEIGTLDPELKVMIDSEKMRQALTNVLSNAHKYSPKGGLIHVSQQCREKHGKTYAGLCVTDEGIGMTNAQLGRVFERFYRVDTSGNIPGTGLGLCLVKEIIELQDGQVEINSTFGQGTQVTLWLPCSTHLVLS